MSYLEQALLLIRPFISPLVPLNLLSMYCVLHCINKTTYINYVLEMFIIQEIVLLSYYILLMQHNL